MALLAATYPERVRRLALYGSYARAVRRARVTDLADTTREHWGTGAPYQFPRRVRRVTRRPAGSSHGTSATAPRPTQPERSRRSTTTSTSGRSWARSPFPPSWSTGRTTRSSTSNGVGELAAAIPQARLMELEGADHLVFTGDPPVLDPVLDFLSEFDSDADTSRLLTSILFVDLVGSTERLGEVGDTRWRVILGRFYAACRAELERHRGREVKTTGDGLLACFDGPARAVYCAWASVGPGPSSGSTPELGAHRRGGGDRGRPRRHGRPHRGSCHVGRRPRRGLAHWTVRDLVAGSGLSVEERACAC